MASSRVEFGSCLLNRPSKYITTTRYEKTNNGYLHSCIVSSNSGNTCEDFESENLKTQNNVDLSWLPSYDDDNKASESYHHSGEIDFDYSWLPDHFDTKRNGSTTASKSSNFNTSTETENDSWLPSTAVVNGGNDDSWLPNYSDVKRNTSTVPSKPNNIIRSQITENDSNYSSFSSTTNGNLSKETINNNKSIIVFSGKQQIQHAKPLNKKPDPSKSQEQVSPSKSDRCSVETDSLGGVSTLRRRFQDLVESRNTRRKAKSSSGINHSKSSLVLTESNNSNPPGSPSNFFDSSDELSSPSTTAASPSAVNTNESFARICNTWDRNQVAGGKTRLIRGREAFNDFLNLIEQDKQLELKSLAQRKRVSQFPYRGRIRALLRVKLIKLNATNNPQLESTTTSNQSAKGINHRPQITELPTPVTEVFSETHDDDIQLENFHDCSSEYSQSQSDWDEEDDWDMQPSYDWISEIARPKSYWECLRQARYKEMLQLYTNQQDIRDLLERRMVTGFLLSDVREKIEQLMVGRAQGMEVRKEGKMEREYRKYNEFIDQRSSSIVTCC
ncbi:hypothetical protein LXL04_019257 [Taraxacum kok-saghyz]